MTATHTEAEVEKLAMALEIQYCSAAQHLRRHGTTLMNFVETGLRDAGVLPAIPPAGTDQRDGHLAAHYPTIAGRLAKMQMEMPACGR